MLDISISFYSISNDHPAHSASLYHQSITSILYRTSSNAQLITMAPAAISPPTSPSLSNATPSTDISAYRGYHHVHWYVGNAKQAAAFYVARMGFERVAYRGLETGSRATASHVVRNGNVTFVLTSPLRCLEQSTRFSEEDAQLLKEIHAHQERHGDAVKGKSNMYSV
jgi:4-hydroxyphenylpyruvate dioxygenase